MEQPTLEPAIGGRDGKRKTSMVPNAVEWRASCDSADQLKKLARGDAGASDKVAPKDGEGAATTFATVAIGAKKRNLLTSR